MTPRGQPGEVRGPINTEDWTGYRGGGIYINIPLQRHKAGDLRRLGERLATFTCKNDGMVLEL